MNSNSILVAVVDRPCDTVPVTYSAICISGMFYCSGLQTCMPCEADSTYDPQLCPRHWSSKSGQQFQIRLAVSGRLLELPWLLDLKANEVILWSFLGNPLSPIVTRGTASGFSVASLLKIYKTTQGWNLITSHNLHFVHQLTSHRILNHIYVRPQYQGGATCHDYASQWMQLFLT